MTDNDVPARVRPRGGRVVWTLIFLSLVVGAAALAIWKYLEAQGYGGGDWHAGIVYVGAAFMTLFIVILQLGLLVGTLIRVKTKGWAPTVASLVAMLLTVVALVGYGRDLVRQDMEYRQGLKSSPALEPLDPLMWAVLDGNVAAAQDRIDELKRTVSSKEFDNRTRNVLGSAVQREDPAMVRALLQKGLSPNPADSSEPLPLSMAARRGNLEIMTILLEGGAKVNAAPHDGRTALHAAASAGHTEAVRLLLDKGATVNPKEADTGATPLDLARQEKYSETAALLENRGGRPGANR